MFFLFIAGEPLRDNVLRHKEPGNQSCRMSRDVKSQTFAPYPRLVRIGWSCKSRVSKRDASGSTHVRESGFQNSEEMFACGILKPTIGFEIRDSAQGIWNPASDWNPESKFHWP